MVSVVFDWAGEVAACVADVALLEAALTPTLLQSPALAASLAAAPLLLLDGNLSAAALEAACAIAGTGAGASDSGASSSDNLAPKPPGASWGSGRCRIWFEPVSAPKSVRAVGVLAQLDFISPNAAELVAMAEALWQRQEGQQDRCQNGGHRKQWPAGSSELGGPASQACGSSSSGGGGGSTLSSSTQGQPGEGAAPTTQIQALLPHVRALLAAGVGHIVLTLGAVGAALCRLDPGGRQVLVTHMPALAAAVVNCSGAGDCLVAGCLFGLAQGSTPEQALSYGLAAARAAVESSGNVPARLSASALARDAAQAGAQACQLTFPAAAS